MNQMDCKTAENLISSYIDQSIDKKYLESFLEHIKSCPSCHDELEINYIISEAAKRLDDDGETLRFDLDKLLNDEIDHTLKVIRREKKMRSATRFILAVLFALSVCGMLYVLLDMFA